MMDKSLSGRVAIITGSSRGIGAATAKEMACRGASVVINYLQNQEKAEEVAEDIKRKGGKALVCKADVRDRKEVDTMVSEAIDRFGKIDILVNNAATASNKDFIETDWDDFQDQMDITLKGAYNCIKSVLPIMLQHRYGRIINVISMMVHIPKPGGYSAYVTAKSSIIGLTRSLAIELAPKGIRINMVAPTLTMTEMVELLPPEALEGFIQNIPCGRAGKPEDLAKGIAFLASEDADFILGITLPICGGLAFI